MQFQITNLEEYKPGIKDIMIVSGRGHEGYFWSDPGTFENLQRAAIMVKEAKLKIKSK